MSALAVADGCLAGFDTVKVGALERVWRALDGAGEETRIVGGAVRDWALGIPVNDVDFATTALPDVVIARAKAAGLRAIPTGIDHGTVTLVAEGRPFEVTTLRRDVATDGRHAKVAFGRDFRADAERRDFTINALGLDRLGRIHDPVGGLADLAAGRVRFIGDAQARVREDHLRILRFFRFSAAYGRDALDADGLKACIAGRAGLSALSRERVRAEVIKWLGAARAGETATEAAEAGLLDDALGGVAMAARLRKVIAIERKDAAAADPLLRLAALAVMTVEDAKRLRTRLRLSNAEGDRLDAMASALPHFRGRAAPPSLGDLRVMLFERGRRAALDALMLAQADSLAPPDDEAYRSARGFLAATPEPKMPFGGGDLLKRGVADGPGMGMMLKELQAMWIRAGLPKEPEILARLLEEAMRRFGAA